MRRSSVFFIQIAFGLIILCLIFIHSHISVKNRENEIRIKREMVKTFGITDLCLFTEARYTRHPSMADLNTPFQDYPLSLEHFPSGSLMGPPEHVKSERKFRNSETQNKSFNLNLIDAKINL